MFNRQFHGIVQKMLRFKKHSLLKIVSVISLFFALTISLLAPPAYAKTPTPSPCTQVQHGLGDCGDQGGGQATAAPSPTATDDCKFQGLCSECSNADVKGCVCTASNGSVDECGGDAAAASSCGKDSCDLVGKYLDPLINLLSGLVGIAVVISIILGGVQYTTSAGDPQKAAKAKSRITTSIIAMISFMFLYAFLQFLIPGGILHP